MNTRALPVWAVAVVLLAASVPPAVASPGDNETGAFLGTATVGKGFRDLNTWAPADCTKNNAHRIKATGNGLQLPSNNQKKNAAWQLKVSLIRLGGPAQLDICGYLTHVVRNQEIPLFGKLGGFGAACGMSKGYNGVGKIRFMDGDKTAKKAYDNVVALPLIKLSGVGWKMSAGELIVAFGRGHRMSTHNKQAKTKAYQFVMVAQMAGGASCLAANGAKSFLMYGEYSLLWSGGLEGLTWNDLLAPLGPKDDSPLGGDKKSGTGPKACNVC